MDAALAWLDRHGAGDVAHPGGTLRGHLVRVADRLAAWGLSDVVRLAGLTHAAYGTAGFDDHLITPAQRDDLRAAIGAEAEALVYTYGACDRSTSAHRLPATALRDLDLLAGGTPTGCG